MPPDTSFLSVELSEQSDLERWAGHAGDGPVLVDLDHTLLAGNSFELFLESLHPRILVSTILSLAGLPPWRLLSRQPDRLRESMIFLAVLCLMPWALVRWRRVGPRLFRQHANSQLEQALGKCRHDRLEIVTFGFSSIVKPMLRGSRWAHSRLNCTTPSLLLRQDWSKLSRARRLHTNDDLAQASFVTDSADDADLLALVANGYLMPPAGSSISAKHKLYFPLRYTAIAKYTPAYLRDQTLFVDLPVILFAFVFGARRGWMDLAAALLLYVSLMCVYEIGYFENDQAKSTRETHRRVTATANLFRNFPLPQNAWAWATVLGGIGIGLESHLNASVFVQHLARWVPILIALRLCYRLYNMRGERFRVLAYPVLQLFKYGWPLLFVAFSPLAGAIIASQIVVMWAVYLVYRHGGNGDGVPREAVRVGVLLLLATFAVGWPVVLKQSSVVLAFVCAWLAWRVTPKRRVVKALLQPFARSRRPAA